MDTFHQTECLKVQDRLLVDGLTRKLETHLSGIRRQISPKQKPLYQVKSLVSRGWKALCKAKTCSVPSLRFGAAVNVGCNRVCRKYPGNLCVASTEWPLPSRLHTGNTAQQLRIMVTVRLSTRNATVAVASYMAGRSFMARAKQSFHQGSPCCGAHRRRSSPNG